MTFDVLGYDFPHWKTNVGLLHLMAADYRPRMVWLAPRKELSIPRSDYRIGPASEFWPHPRQVCESYGIKYNVIDHDVIGKHTPDHHKADFAVILGARILKQHTIDAYRIGIINIHPGILPGNRGLDNLKWAIVKGLPIGATAHLIDSRVDMGYILHREFVDVTPDMELRELPFALRYAEMQALVYTMATFTQLLDYKEPVEYSEKFSALPPKYDHALPRYWEHYKQTKLLETI